MTQHLLKNYLRNNAFYKVTHTRHVHSIFRFLLFWNLFLYSFNYVNLLYLFENVVKLMIESYVAPIAFSKGRIVMQAAAFGQSLTFVSE